MGTVARGETSMKMVTGMGVNGFGRIGRLVTRIIMEDDDCEINAINAGSATPDYMAYQYKYDTIHGIAKGTVESEEGALILPRSAGVRRMPSTSASLLVSSLPRRLPSPSSMEAPRRSSTPPLPRMTP